MSQSWRGGFLLSALELYLKIDMKAKFQFLADLEAAVGFTSTLMTQNNWGNDKNEGLTTMVPQVAFQDYFKLISDPKLPDLHRFIQGGQVAAWEKTALMKTHYSIAHTLNECLAKLEEAEGEPDNLPAEAKFERSHDARRRSKVRARKGLLCYVYRLLHLPRFVVTLTPLVAGQGPELRRGGAEQKEQERFHVRHNRRERGD